jgi:arylsulfatase A-like enzyme
MKVLKISPLLFVLIACWGSIAPVLAQDSKPNILVIFGDDIGWMNVSSYGSDIMGVKTPNIDRIGQEGLRLSSFYAQPSCTAGRAAFITGQLPVRTGLTTVGTEGGHHACGDSEGARLLDCTVRQEPPRRPGRTSAAPPWLRRVLGQSVSPQRQ